MPGRRRIPNHSGATQVLDDPPRDHDLWFWLLVPLVLVGAALIGAGLAFRQNSGSSASTTAAPVKAIVPGVVGLQILTALAHLHVQGLRANVVAVPSSEPTGRVVAQHPKAGAGAPEGSAVRLNVSKMPSNSGTTDVAAKPPASLAAALTVPDVRGQKVNDARKELRRTGLVIDDRRVRNDLPKNSVVSQSPAPGTAARPGDHVLVTVSSGGAKRHGGRHREANENEDRG